ncbi:hypothetical protein ACIQOW_01330 [Kitasatospora sp. NPDC091335]|uniref:hypothetical protein n=1 Tax=Kitasatospora sp. NPDC091335 TaxID=3364085 RepID=UPI0037F87A1C
MTRNEVLKHVVAMLAAGDGMLTSDQPEFGAEFTKLLGEVVNDSLGKLQFNDDQPPSEVLPVVGQAFAEPLMDLVGGFMVAFLQLAQVHDSGQTAVSSKDVLQDLSLRAEQDG